MSGYQACYNEATNEITLGGGTVPIRVGKSLICGFKEGDASGPPADGIHSMTGSYGVNLSRTSCIFVQSNLSSSNRDPVHRATGSVLGKVPLTTQQRNEIISYSSPVAVRLVDKFIFNIQLRLADDSGFAIDLNGLQWSATLQFTLEKDDDFQAGVPRYLPEATDAVTPADTRVDEQR